ncbi:hypothetical protein HMI55_006108, partial [Coelomomyces lativittatus]
NLLGRKKSKKDKKKMEANLLNPLPPLPSARHPSSQPSSSPLLPPASSRDTLSIQKSTSSLLTAYANEYVLEDHLANEDILFVPLIGKSIISNPSPQLRDSI